MNENETELSLMNCETVITAVFLRWSRLRANVFTVSSNETVKTENETSV